MATGIDEQPILASWKISEVLQKYPHLLETLIDLSPAFSKLRNPLMRKVQTRLVTVAQAAEIAGLSPADLTQKLNQAAGISALATPDDSASDSASEAATGQPDWANTARIVTELDARPLLERGEEPFHAIMKTATGVPAGSAFRLLVGFEPVPLYDALAKLGFDHLTTTDGDCWTVLFYRRPGAGPVSARPAEKSAIAAGEPDWDAPAAAEVTIDVSELVPPEPMIKILEALEQLPAGGRLLVHHVRRPMHLYGRLDEMGYAHATRELGPGRVEVLIQKQGPSAP